MARRTRKSDTTAFTADEMLYVKKYPTHQFKPQSLTMADPANGVNKRTITFACPDCKGERTVPTSDIFHCFKCVDCTKATKKAKKAKK